jgi:predicted outer membrane repeat protein
MKKTILFLLFFLTFSFKGLCTTYYVHSGRTNNNGNGLNWVNAKKDLQAAIDAASYGDEIWVRADTYLPTFYLPPLDLLKYISVSQSRTFLLKDGVKIYGGFIGTETLRDQRDFVNNITILSGDLNNDSPSTRTDDAYHVVTSSNNTEATLLDGLTIQYGNSYAANGPVPDSQISKIDGKRILPVYGAGLYIIGNEGPTISNCRFINNNAHDLGGGIYTISENLIIKNTTFQNNHSGTNGGAIFGAISNSATTNIEGSTFINNTAKIGGALMCRGSNVITNSTFENNTGSAIEATASTITINSSLFKNNNAGQKNGGAISASGSVLNLNNSTFSNNQGVQGGAIYQNYRFIFTYSFITFEYLTTNNCKFINNIAQNTSGIGFIQPKGAAIYSDSQGATHTNTLFSNNVSYNQGGVYFSTTDNADRTLNFYNCIFTKNKTEGSGAVIYNKNQIINLVNCTAIDNSSNNTGGGVSAFNTEIDGQTNFINCILGSTTNLLAGSGFTFTDYCLTSNAPLPSGYGNVVGNPNFINQNDTDGIDNVLGTNDDGFNIQANSAAINAGDPYITTPIKDIKAFDRVGRFDIGAYEFCPNSNGAIVINSQPSNAGSILGGQVSFSVNALASNLSYQWRRGSTNVGTNSNILTISNLTVADAGSYTCVISNNCNTITSAAATLTVNATQKIYYVRSEIGHNANNGLSWATAKKDLQEAINLATAGDMVWVKAGTYKPTKDAFGNEPINSEENPKIERDKTFYLKNGVKIYGGFAGTETSLSQRNAATNPTILSGDVKNTPSDITDDVFHVLLSVKDNINTQLDGFTIQHGNATGGGNNIQIEGASVPQNFGGGMCNFNSWPTISNCIFKNNTAQTGGAIQNTDNTFATINNCTFLNNTAKDTGGGAIANEINSDPTISNCVFSGNAANGSAVSSGGAIFVNGGICTAINCVFTNNTANFKGGAVSVSFSSICDISSSTFYNNTATSPSAKGAGISFDASCTGKIYTSIFYYNTTAITTDTGRENIFSEYTGSGSNALVTANSCLIADATGSPLAITNVSLNNCLNGNPLFVNPADPDGTDNTWATADDGLHLQNASPAINYITENIIANDITGFARSASPADIGAYEHKQCIAPVIASQISTITACAGENIALSVNAYGDNLTYQWLKEEITIDGGSDSYLIDELTATTAGNYKYTLTNTCGSITSNAIAVNISTNYTTNTWLGLSTDWHDRNNWSAGVVPNGCSQVIIPSGLANMPNINTDARCHSIQVAGTVNVEANILKIYGN